MRITNQRSIRWGEFAECLAAYLPPILVALALVVLVLRWIVVLVLRWIEGWA